MKLSINDFFSKCDQIRRKLRIWSHLTGLNIISSNPDRWINCPVETMLCWIS